ncbi:MAG: hypothetical protein OEV42_04355, partial [Deltaproteobacteria bacterium]|nr:hypothetical protein [Deltaproteobacteria bacterium]
WAETDSALCSLGGCLGLFSFEIVRCESGIEYFLGYPKSHPSSSIEGVLKNISPKISLEKADDPLGRIKDTSVDGFSLFELLYEKPYYQRMLDYKDLSIPSLTSLLKAFSAIPSDGIAVFQLLFEPCSQDWAKSIKSCISAESALRTGRRSQREMKDLRKPFFAVRPRVLFSSPLKSSLLQPFLGGLQAQGRRAGFHDLKTLSKAISKERLIEMLISRESYMTGMVMNSSELASCFFHLPDEQVKALDIPVVYDDGVIVPVVLRSGIPIGTAGTQKAVICIPGSSNNLNSLRIGSSGSGKTSSITNQFFYHVDKGEGAVLLDPHGDLIEELLSSPKLSTVVEKVVYFNPVDDEYAIGFNPFHLEDIKDIGRLTSDYVNSSKNLFDSWGPRQAHILTVSYYAIFLLGENLSALPELLSRTPGGETMRREVIERSDSPEVIRFFKDEFKNYRDEAFFPVTSKVSSLLIDSRSRMILSEKENKVNMSKILNEGHILLASLPVGLLGADISFQLGTMLLSQIQKAAFHRASMRPEERRPCHIFVDECYRFNEKIYDGFLNETRKYGCSIHLALQNTGQLSEDSQKAFFSVNNLLAFGINIDDAKRLSRVLDNRVKPEELVSLGVGEAVARLGKEIIKIDSFKPVTGSSDAVREQIIEYSRKHYYTKIEKQKEREVSDKKKRFYDSF